MKRLTQSFFNQATVKVARELLGKTLVFQGFQGMIVETEAYVGQEDPACHAARGMTPRNAVMFGPSGMSYVYFIYGMYHCFNVVTEREGFPAAVLIRGVKLLKPDSIFLDGPGKLCRHLGLTRAHNNLDLTRADDFMILEEGVVPKFVQETPRIGIRQGLEKPWRFVLAAY